jgi:NADH:ubiquinone oxidoreductase subunit 6 (subunit J)
MLLNIRLIDLTDQFFNYFPAGMIIGFIFLFEFNLYIYFDLYYTFTNLDIYYIYIDFINNIDAVSDIILIAYILYEEYFLLFIFAAILLLVAMVGVILLTLRNVIEVKTQLIYSQVYRLLLLKNSTF